MFLKSRSTMSFNSLSFFLTTTSKKSSSYFISDVYTDNILSFYGKRTLLQGRNPILIPSHIYTDTKTKQKNTVSETLNK